ncbi:septal ring lytic transglycosylase RlpA family protein [Flammeovirga sp. MY04]|uniref:septal ring lytic transglycosylase RlpA family protein n=1 Tax=Flammeovirga sp. MY04 TaxID=1191459 RepID=UPI0008063446|nr:septal ring lytic transglycosylase RlpA family protein [Flammeovirga sp. MY04]ANQ48445.1 septal ring lytic transglycosylase RlpA family protein [Flammeovirga sp. MY04]
MNKYKFLLLISLLFSTFVFGQKKVGDVKKGQASYYANKFHGKKTANGERFNMYAFTCAHRELPFDTYLKVTNLKNNNWVVVRVNDRGPFKAHRIIDLSKAAAAKIDMVKDGIGDVSIEVLYINGQGTKVKEGTTGVTGDVIPKNKYVKETPKKDPPKTASKPKGEFAAPGTYSIWGTPKNIKNGYGVQMASYTDVKKAISNGKKANKKGLSSIFIQAGWSNDKKVYRLIYGDLSEADARNKVSKVRGKGYKGAFVKKHL